MSSSLLYKSLMLKFQLLLCLCLHITHGWEDAAMTTFYLTIKTIPKIWEQLDQLLSQSLVVNMDKRCNNFSDSMNLKKDLCELDPDEVPFYTDEDISLALADDDEVQSENGISNIYFIALDFKGRRAIK